MDPEIHIKQDKSYLFLLLDKTVNIKNNNYFTFLILFGLKWVLRGRRNSEVINANVSAFPISAARKNIKVCSFISAFIVFQSDYKIIDWIDVKIETTDNF